MSSMSHFFCQVISRWGSFLFEELRHEKLDSFILLLLITAETCWIEIHHLLLPCILDLSLFYKGIRIEILFERPFILFLHIIIDYHLGLFIFIFFLFYLLLLLLFFFLFTIWLFLLLLYLVKTSTFNHSFFFTFFPCENSSLTNSTLMNFFYLLSSCILNLGLIIWHAKHPLMM